MVCRLWQNTPGMPKLAGTEALCKKHTSKRFKKENIQNVSTWSKVIYLVGGGYGVHSVNEFYLADFA